MPGLYELTVPRNLFHTNKCVLLISKQDKLYRYMEERYLVTDIMYLCTFDFLNAVTKYAETDKVKTGGDTSEPSREKTNKLGFQTGQQVNTNRPVQSQKQARNLKFQV